MCLTILFHKHLGHLSNLHAHLPAACQNAGQVTLSLSGVWERHFISRPAIFHQWKLMLPCCLNMNYLITSKIEYGHLYSLNFLVFVQLLVGSFTTFILIRRCSVSFGWYLISYYVRCSYFARFFIYVFSLFKL